MLTVGEGSASLPEPVEAPLELSSPLVGVLFMLLGFDDREPYKLRLLFFADFIYSKSESVLPGDLH